MTISSDEAKNICIKVLKALDAWPELNIALQCGGLERKAIGVISSAISDEIYKKNLFLIQEYRFIDIAAIKSSSEFMPTLEVEFLFEVKFNYAKQSSEIKNRLCLAVDQATRYAKKVRARNAYILYFIAAPYSSKIPPKPHDSGWPYWNHPLDVGVKAFENEANLKGIKILGSHCYQGNQPMFFSLIDCDLHPDN